LLWLPTRSREQLVGLGEEFVKSDESEGLDWIVENLKGDPDPSVENASDDPEGKFNDHLQTRHGKNHRVIRSVRGRLCWLLAQIVTKPRLQDYERVFEIVEKFATEENLYVRQQACVPLIELARRRFALVDNARFMSDQLADRIKALALRMADENLHYPAVLEWVAHVIWPIQDLDSQTALSTLSKFVSIDNSEAAIDISYMMIYFSFYRENRFPKLATFQSHEIRGLLKERTSHGSERFRAATVDHFKTILDRGEVEFVVLFPYLESAMDGPMNPFVNHKLYGIASTQAAAYPGVVGNLVEQAVVLELKSLDSGGRGVWHPKSFSQALDAIQQAGPEHHARVEKMRKLIEPYKASLQICDVYDF
jgi:hypothetical protein